MVRWQILALIGKNCVVLAEVALDRFIADEGQIARLNLPDGCAVRLKSLGLFEGQNIQLAKRGNPLILKAAGGRIAVADEIASQIFVRALDE